MIWKIIYFAVIIVICYFAGRISKKITDLIFSNRLKNVINNEAKVKTLKTVTTSVFKFGIYLVAVLSVLVQLGVSPTALTAISGSIAVAIGLGAQNVVSDIIAGIFILCLLYTSAYKLRVEGVKAECDSVGRSVKAQMKYANKTGAKYSVILGDNEIEQDSVKLKNMETGEDETVKVSDLFDIMKNKK